MIPVVKQSCYLISLLWFQTSYQYSSSYQTIPAKNVKLKRPSDCHAQQQVRFLYNNHNNNHNPDTLQQQQQQQQEDTHEYEQVVSAPLAFVSNHKYTSPPPPPIIACSSTIEVIRAISMYIQPNDTIFELGSHLSQVSTHLCQTIGSYGKAILVDVQRSDAKSGRTLHRHVQDFVSIEEQTQDSNNYNNNNNNTVPKYSWASFIQLQSFHQWRSILYANTQDDECRTTIRGHKHQHPILFDAMILDVAASIGNDLYMTALTTAEEFMYHQQQQQQIQAWMIRNEQQQQQQLPNRSLRVIIIKSRNLSSLARRLVHSQRLFDTTVQLPSNHNNNNNSMMMMIRSHEPYIIATVGVEEYRRTIPFVVRPGDSCIEVGCHLGRTTLALYNAAVIKNQNHITNQNHHHHYGFCIGVDISPKIIQHAKDELPYINFAVADAWRVMDLIRLKSRFIKIENENTSTTGTFSETTTHDWDWKGYDVIYADLGGLSGPDGLIESLAFIDSLARGIEPRTIVIKSLCLNRLASRLRSFTNEWQKNK